MKEKNISDIMTCVEKRHMNHRVGSMLHHRFPNGFTDLLMDETDREVSTLTDRAFRSLCIGDDAVYNDEFSYGYSPFSCHKPLAGEAHMKTIKEAKKQSRNDKHESQPWKQQQQKTMSQMTSFLKALSATEESYGGVFKKNRMTDSNGESWDKSALRSIQKELSEFSADYNTNLTEGQYIKQTNKHFSGDASNNKKDNDKSFSSGKHSKNKTVKTNVKLKKLNIKNFFLHSEFSPFQAWTDLHRFSFAQESIAASILPEDPVPKWFDLPFYKELSEVSKKETPPEDSTEEPESCQTAPMELGPSPPPPPPPPPPEPKPISPPVPPKVLPKPVLTTAEKRCTSEGGDGNAAPWRQNRSRATSAVPINQPGIQSQDVMKLVDENLLLLKKVDENLLLLKKADENLTLFKKEARSVEVKTVEEVNSLASTPFSICQLMTPIIPSRQPTDTSEILTVLSPSALDLPLRPQSEAKVTPEPPLKRDSYKSLASSILFNLKDNRKRVKSRYSPRKFKTLEETESGSPLLDNVKQVFSEGIASGMNTPAIVKDVETICSPLSEISIQSVDLSKHDVERPLSNDYLLTHLLQNKAEMENSPMSPLLQMKKSKSPLAKKQNYPSLNLYKKASSVNSDVKYIQPPLSLDASVHTEIVKNCLSPPPLKDLSPFPSPKTRGLSPNTTNAGKDLSSAIPSPIVDKEDLSLQEKVIKRSPDFPEKTKRKNSIEPVSVKENNAVNQPVIEANVIKLAREAINAAKQKALSASDSLKEPAEEINEVRAKVAQPQKTQDILVTSENAEITEPNSIDGKNIDKKKQPPPVPKRNFTKSDIQLSVDNHEKLTNGDLDTAKADAKLKNKKEVAQKQGKLKHVFSARQNNYIKNQRHARVNEDECEESDRKVSVRPDNYEPEASRETRDSESIISDLNALKELERARLAERIFDNAKTKFGVVDIVEQTKARNDLISRELRSIKKGMLSMRGNTTAKREVFAKKEREQSKKDVYTKFDSNVIVNKALINDNYDRAKMALEEIISERERRKNLTEQEESEQAAAEDMHGFQKQKMMSESKEKPNGLNALELKERLGDLQDHSHMRHILSHTEPRQGEMHREGTRTVLPGMDNMMEELNTMVKAKSEKIDSSDSKEQGVDSNLASEETSENKHKRQDAPPVPPRSRKGSIRRDSVGQDTEIGIKQIIISELHTHSKDEKEGQCIKNELNNVCSAKENLQELETDLNNARLMHSKYTSLNTEQKDTLYLSAEVIPDNKKHMSPTSEIIPERKLQGNGTGKVKRRAPLRPDYVNTSLSKDPNNILDQPEKTTTNEESKLIVENLVESPRTIISPLLLVNGVSICQSPPDQASLSSKSSYFSAESTLHRNTENESNVYHSLEKLTGEVEEAESAAVNKSRHNSDRTETEYYSFSDHENEVEMQKRQIKSPLKDAVVFPKKAGDKLMKVNHETMDETSSAASSNPVSPTFAIPALFKVKDNTFSNKPKKLMQAWSPRGNLAGLENVLMESKSLEPQSHEDLASHTTISVEQVLPSLPHLILPTSPPRETLMIQYEDCSLRVPEQEDRNSGVSPLTEGVDSTAASTVETVDEAGVGSGIECEVSKVPSERSESTCSGNDSQTGLPKPPAVLPKSEKAVLRAIKLTNRRIKKEEAQKSSHKSWHSSSKHRSDRHKSDKSEQKGNSGRNSKSGDRKHKENAHSVHQNVEDRVSQSQNITDKTDQATKKLSVESSVERSNLALASERQGRSSDRHVRDTPEHRHYSSDRVFSNVPVYKTSTGDRPRADRPFQRSLSTDRYIENRVERRLSADMSTHDRLDSRSQRIEKSIMDDLQQRGRQKDKPSKDSPLRRSQSIDSQNTNMLHPPNLSRQSSLSSQFSRQSSIEHTVIASSFPMTQRKLLQDPDSGHYFFVDMPVQVKTKTFYDPETGTYVQLPVQPPEGAVTQPTPVEVLSPPLMVYHSFVPVSLSPMAQAAPVQPPQLEHEERATRTDAFIEPVFGQHEHMLGEFLGTEELDCPS